MLLDLAEFESIQQQKSEAEAKSAKSIELCKSKEEFKWKQNSWNKWHELVVTIYRMDLLEALRRLRASLFK